MTENIIQYDLELTNRVQADTDQVIDEMIGYLPDEPEGLLSFLNDADTIVTPGKILLRCALQEYPEEVQAINKELGIKISAEENIRGTLSEQVVKELSERIGRAMAQRNITMNIPLADYLLGNRIPTKRDICFKLIAGFRMDDRTAAKFLLSSNQEILSPRNPYDYLFLYIRKTIGVDFDWNVFSNLVTAYQNGRPKRNERNEISPVAQKQGVGGTEFIRQRLDEMTEAYLPERENASCTQEQLLSYMWENDDLFTLIKKKNDRSKTGQYRAGISFTGLLKMKEMAEYLALLYPQYKQYKRMGYNEHDGNEFLVKYPVRDSSGKISISQLVLAMTQVKGWVYYDQTDRNDEPAPDFKQMTQKEKHNWFIEEYERVQQMSLEERNQWLRGSDELYGNLDKEIKKQIDEIPFNRYVVMFCKEFRKRIRKIMNIDDRKVANIEPITRNDILFLSYMFLSGYMMDRENVRETLKEKAFEAEGSILRKGAESLSEEDRLKGKVGHCISEIITQMEEIKYDEAEAGYKIKACLDQFLKLFDFDELYLPLVFERFVFLCLVKEYQEGNDDATYEIINTGYMLSVEDFLKK